MAYKELCGAMNYVSNLSVIYYVSNLPAAQGARAREGGMERERGSERGSKSERERE
jgi:hypothetical protein